MTEFKEKKELINPNDIRAIQRLVIANSFENIKFGNNTKPAELSDGLSVTANVYDKKTRLSVRKKAEITVDVDSANPVPSLDEINPFIDQLLLRERDSFTVRTSFNDEWIAVRFALSDSERPSVPRSVSEPRDLLWGIF